MRAVVVSFVLMSAMCLVLGQEISLVPKEQEEASGCQVNEYEEGRRPVTQCFRKRRDAGVGKQNGDHKGDEDTRKRRWLSSLRQSAIRYQGAYFDFQSNNRVKENRKKENWTSTAWVWSSGGESYCTLDEVREFNGKWKPPYSWWWTNSHRYIKDLKRFLHTCRCETPLSYSRPCSEL